MRFAILLFITMTYTAMATGVTTSRRNVFNALQTMKQGLKLKNSDVTLQSEPGGGTIKIVIKNGDQEYHLKIDGSADDAFKITDGTDSVDVFHITTTGLVGIGNITPLEDFHLSAATPTLRLTDTGGGYTDLDASSGFFVIEVDDNNNIDDSIFTLDIDGTEQIRVTTGGLMSIGNIAPLEDFHISSATPTIRLTDTGGGYTDLDASSGLFAIEVDDNNNVDDSIFTVDIDGTEQIRITTGGLLGLGNIAPLEDFHLSSATPTIRLTDTGGGYVDFDANGGNLVVEIDEAGTEASSYFAAEIDGNEGFRVDSSGNMSIGTTTADGLLHVKEAAVTDNAIVESTNDGSGYGPEVVLSRESASPAASDGLGELIFRGQDSAGNNQAYGTINGFISSPTSGAESGEVRIFVSQDGSLTNTIKMKDDGSLHLVPMASPPPDPDAGDIYMDTSGALCVYAAAWEKLNAAGTCA
jgi:hypothetical protein